MAKGKVKTKSIVLGVVAVAAAVALIGGVSSIVQSVKQKNCKEHIWNDGKVLKAASCVDEGEVEYKCTECGFKERQIVEALGHNEVAVESVPATCTKPGKASYTYCDRCDENLTGETITPAKGHTEVLVAGVEPTCLKGGLTEGSKCSECGEVLKKQQTIAPRGHIVENTQRVEPTCETDGWSAGSSCTVCGEVYIERTQIPATGHTLIPVSAQAATCKAIGWKAYEYCSVCEHTTYEEIPLADHMPVEIEGLAATCTTKGISAGTSCGVCNVKLSGQEIIPALGHNEVVVAAVPATCTTTGLSGGIECSRCDLVVEAQRVVPAKGHTTVNVSGYAATCTTEGLSDGKKCSSCGVWTQTQSIIAAKNHLLYRVGEKAATCQEVGWDAYEYCGRCDYTTYRELGKTDHTSIVLPGKAATCTADGLTEGKKCSVCSFVLVPQTKIPLLGHDERVIDGYAATCTEPGRTGGQDCSRCGKVLIEQETIAALGHTPIDIPAVAATCTETGLAKGSKCSVCDTVLASQSIVNALGHNLTTHPAKAATCKEGGNEEYQTCSRCDYTTYEATMPIPHNYVNAYCTMCGELESNHTHVYSSSELNVAPTCTTVGSKKVICACGETKLERIAALGHAYEVVAGKNATCSESGLTDGSACVRCGDVNVVQEEIPMLDHSFDRTSGLCLNCGAKANEIKVAFFINDSSAELIRENVICSDQYGYVLNYHTSSEYGDGCIYMSNLASIRFEFTTGCYTVRDITVMNSVGDSVEYTYSNGVLMFDVNEYAYIRVYLNNHQYTDNVCMLCGKAFFGEVDAVVGEKVAGNWYRIYRAEIQENPTVYYGFGIDCDIQGETIYSEGLYLGVVPKDMVAYGGRDLFVGLRNGAGVEISSTNQVTVTGIDTYVFDEYVDLFISENATVSLGESAYGDFTFCINADSKINSVNKIGSRVVRMHNKALETGDPVIGQTLRLLGTGMLTLRNTKGDFIYISFAGNTMTVSPEGSVEDVMVDITSNDYPIQELAQTSGCRDVEIGGGVFTISANVYDSTTGGMQKQNFEIVIDDTWTLESTSGEGFRVIVIK